MMWNCLISAAGKVLPVRSKATAAMLIAWWSIAAVVSALPLQAASPDEVAQQILQTTGTSGGLILHVGCGDGTLTAALGRKDAFLVQGLDPDPDNVERARQHVRQCGLYGRVSIDRLQGGRLPYINNLANLVVVSDASLVSPDEAKRVLCPGGTACVDRDGQWVWLVKPWPDEIDQWTHYLYDASNNAVSRDRVVGPPRRLQWVGSPRYSRHHDRMSSVSAVVSAGGRVFYIFDEASAASILLPPKWALIARDAFNGVVLWKRPIERWHTHLWPLKSGPAQLPRRLVAAGDRVYATLSLDAPITALDAATGEIGRAHV